VPSGGTRWPRPSREVKGSEIIITLPGTSYAVNYYMLANSPQLHGSHLPDQVDRRSLISQAAFVRKAWKLANDKARELGWIV